MYDIIVIGAGPAGMTAAIYGARGGMSVLMLDRLTYGGQIVNTPEVENYPGAGKISGFELAQDIFGQATGLGAGMQYEEVSGVQRSEDGRSFTVVCTGGNEYQGRSVILATGVKNRPMGLPREEELKGSGISYCATCDGAFYRGKDVIVLGGGNTALGDADYLTGMVKRVYLVHRRDQFRGDRLMVDRLRKKPNVELVLDSVPERILGEGRVSGLEVRNVKTGELRQIEASGIFVAYGHIAQNQAFADLAELDPAGFFASGEDCRTKTPGLFVAGDARAKERRQLVTAAADGSVAAMAAIDWLNANS